MSPFAGHFVEIKALICADIRPSNGTPTVVQAEDKEGRLRG